jgi:hypothetical protein
LVIFVNQVIDLRARPHVNKSEPICVANWFAIQQSFDHRVSVVEIKAQIAAKRVVVRCHRHYSFDITRQFGVLLR